MTYGPNLILKLPGSGTLVKIRTLASGNTFGARFWTDGKREAMMLPEQPWLRRTLSNELFWTDAGEQVAEEAARHSPDESYRDVPFALDPTAYDYELVLLSGSASTPEKKRYARMHRWWMANDPVRRGEAEAPTSAEFQENLRELLALLDINSPDDRLCAAEASRQLRDFISAKRLLDFEFPEAYGEVVALIKRLVGEQDYTVREVI